MYFYYSGDGLEVEYLDIKPAFRNAGIGTKIIQYAFRIAKQREVPVCLYVFCRNTKAVRFYERLGFRVAGTMYKMEKL
ncbi:MAG: GNAT family N-acetyltransferase [Lysinibacillus sp.]